MASNDSSDRPVFIQEELDDVSLTPEQHTELELSTDWAEYRALKLDYPVRLLDNGGGTGSLAFYSDRSDGSDSSSYTCYSTSSCEKSEVKQDGAVYLRAHIGPDGKEAFNVNSISAISHIPANLWNKYPVNIFQKFKVKTYIVQPNYFLSVSKSKSKSRAKAKICDFLTIDHIFNMINSTSSSSHFPQWSVIESGVDSLLAAFDDADLKNLPNVLNDREKALSLATGFLYRLRANLKSLPSRSFLREVISQLLIFADSLLESIDIQQFKEELSVKYIMALIWHFEKLMRLPISHREKEDVTLDLMDMKTKQGKEMTVIPDITIYYHSSCILVGEIKPQHNINKKKEREKDSSKSLEPEAGSSKEKVSDRKRTEVPCSACEIVLQGEQEAEEHFDSVQHAKRIKLIDDEIPCMNNCGLQMEAKENSLKGGGDANVSDGVMKPDHGPASSCGTSDTTRKETNSKFYRHLTEEEALQVTVYLPQLLAEMLGCMRGRPANVHIGRDNENTQLGFAVEGFKLRLVRFVLRNTRDLKEKPTVSIIRNSDVRCEMFLTKEFNLFNKRHLKMFFQMLFAFTYLYEF